MKLTKDEISTAEIFSETLREFKDAYENLLIIWNGLDINAIDLFSEDIYPFEKSFDEYDIHGWERNFRLRLQEYKDDDNN